MARPIWSGVVSFGMVSIPVRLFTAIQEKDLRFHQIHATCGSRIKLQKYCPVDERVVDNGEIRKGYEVAKGSYVLLDEEDFEDLPVASTHTIEVGAFVKVEEVDPVYFETTYYMAPDEAGRKPYALLVRALRDKGVTALGKIALRNKEKLCLVRPFEDSLIVETLYYPDEIRASEDLKLGDVKVNPTELKMAESLVDLLSERFDPAKYEDEYRKALMARIEAKVQGKQVQPAPEAPQTQVIDLMEALRKSVEAAKTQRRKSG